MRDVLALEKKDLPACFFAQIFAGHRMLHRSCAPCWAQLLPLDFSFESNKKTKHCESIRQYRTDRVEETFHLEKRLVISSYIFHIDFTMADLPQLLLAASQAGKFIVVALFCAMACLQNSPAWPLWAPDPYVVFP